MKPAAVSYASGAGLDQDVDHVAVLVHRAPEILPAAVEHHKQLVEMPRVAHSAAATPECAGA